MTLSPALSRAFPIRWTDLCNRNERLARVGTDARDCLWTDSSLLTVARVFPDVGGRLLRRCFAQWPLSATMPPAHDTAGGAAPRISVVLPFSGENRLAACRTVVAAFLAQTVSDAEVIVAEHAAAHVWRGMDNDRLRHVHLNAAAGTFNKSLAINAGVALANADIVLIHDADIVPPAGYLAEILHTLSQGLEAARLLRFLFQLTRSDSVHFIETGGRAQPAAVSEVRQNFPGGSTAVRKDVYWKIGGHDEAFEGWGGEDLEFLDRLATRKLYRGQYLPAVHLWHTPAEKKRSGDKNLDMLAKAMRRPAGERIARLWANIAAGRATHRSAGSPG